MVLPDAEVVARVLAGERGLFEIVMRRHNQRLYRAARAIVSDENEVEDILQQAYLNAFTHLDQFEARAQLSTWLTRIVINEASARRRKLSAARMSAPRPQPGLWSAELSAAGLSRQAPPDRMHDAPFAMDTIPAPHPDPEHQAYAGELHRVLEEAVDALPEHYRLVFVLRDVEGLSTTETAQGLGIGDEAVKTRLHRARAMIRRSVTARLGAVASGAFQFQAPRCDRVVAAVLRQIAPPRETSH